MLQNDQNKICCYQIHHSENYTQLNILCFITLKRPKDSNAMLHKINQFDYNFVWFICKKAMFTPYFKQYIDVVQKKNDNRNCSVYSPVSKNTIGVNVS